VVGQNDATVVIQQDDGGAQIVQDCTHLAVGQLELRQSPVQSHCLPQVRDQRVEQTNFRRSKIRLVAWAHRRQQGPIRLIVRDIGEQSVGIRLNASRAEADHCGCQQRGDQIAGDRPTVGRRRRVDSVNRLFDRLLCHAIGARSVTDQNQSTLMANGK
jgi:hypothetical protein